MASFYKINFCMPIAAHADRRPRCPPPMPIAARAARAAWRFFGDRPRRPPAPKAALSQARRFRGGAELELGLGVRWGFFKILVDSILHLC